MVFKNKKLSFFNKDDSFLFIGLYTKHILVCNKMGYPLIAYKKTKVISVLAYVFFYYLCGQIKMCKVESVKHIYNTS